MHLVKGETALLAWQAGCRHLVGADECEEYNLVTEITKPTILRTSWFEDFNPQAVVGKKETAVSDVTNTIFPRKYAHLEREALYGRYLCARKRSGFGRRRKPCWGTYFERLISFGRGNTKTNQLESAISALKNWVPNYKAALVLSLSSPDIDNVARTMGTPCLRQIHLLCPNRGTVDLLAVYRNHDFLNKAFGNFIGLGCLLGFVCKHTGRKSGKITCLSAHAYATSRPKLIQLAQIQKGA